METQLMQNQLLSFDFLVKFKEFKIEKEKAVTEENQPLVLILETKRKLLLFLLLEYIYKLNHALI